MYFNHAFKKSFLGVASSGSISWRTSGNTSQLTAGQIGLFDAKTNVALSQVSSKPFILAQGSYFTNDKIGPYHGGYKESVKSKVINPKYISKVFTTCANTPVQQIISVGWNLTSNPGTGLAFECGKTYRLRIDLKGSPALRFLSHNVYNTVDFYTGCCTDDCSATCTGDPVDSACVLLGWKDRISINPILSQFIRAQVYVNNAGTATEVFSAYDVEQGNAVSAYSCVTGTGASAVVAGLKITVAYEDTKFGTCTFTPFDHVELHPLQVYVSATDETGDPCAIKPTVNSAGAQAVTEIQAPKQAQGTGERVVRELIIDGRYRQEAFPDNTHVDSLRMREIEGNPALKAFDKTAYYDSINILHSVPRFNNPSGTFDNDQYLLTIYIPTGTDARLFLNTLQDILNCAGNGVVIESTNTTTCWNMAPGVSFVEKCTPGTTTTTTTTTAAPVSDSRLKTNIVATGNTINGLAEYTWDWNQTAIDLGLNGYPTTGVLAQEAMAVNPAFVIFDEEIGYYRVNYDAIAQA